MHVEHSWSALDTRGFVVVRDFLSGDDVASLEAAYRSAERAEVAAYVALEPSRECLLPILGKVDAVLAEVRRATRSAVDTVVDQGVFFATELMNLGWHTDHKSYYVYQHHRDHLSFWLPIIKPRTDKSGLSIVPMDTLRDRDERMFRLLDGRGTARYDDGVFYYEEGGADRRIPCTVDLDDISETPELAPGDALVLRSDVLHRTQDAETARVSLALRALPGDQRLTVSGLLRGSPNKRRRMLREPIAFSETLAAFGLYGRPHMTVRELLDARRRFVKKEFVPRLAFAGARVLLPPLVLAHAAASALARP